MVHKNAIYVGALTALLVTTNPVNTYAAAKVFKHKDEFSGESWSGLNLPSTNQKGRVSIFCRSKDPNPVIIFEGLNFLTSSGNEFQLAYKVDGGPIRHHAFIAGAEHTTGSLSLKNVELYRERYGDRPNYVNRYNEAKQWERRIFTDFVGEFVEGSTAAVRVWDFNGKVYDYKFSLAGMQKNIRAIGSCFSR